MQSFGEAHRLAGALADRELAECLGELPDLADDHTELLLLRVRIETRRQRLTEPWWQWLTDGVLPIGC